MCIGVPMRVLDAGEAVAWCEGRSGRERLDTMLVGVVAPGTWVLAFRGVAQRVLSQEEAEATNAALDALDAALAGQQDLDRYFPDLAGREPQLPPHLRSNLE